MSCCEMCDDMNKEEMCVPASSCQRCGRHLQKTITTYLKCPIHGLKYHKLPPRKKIGDWSGPMGKRQKDLLNGRD